MYKCSNCGNKRNFEEKYYLTTIVNISDSGTVCSYDKQHDISMVTCLRCNNNTEDKSITNTDGVVIEFFT